MRHDAADFFRLTAVLGLSFTCAIGAQAGDILRGGASAGARPGNGRAADANSVRTEQLRANVQDALKRTTEAVQAVQAMQASARAAALKGPNNLGMNPNRPGVRLPEVPNGLVRGGLQIAPGANTPNSPLWKGARLPKETASNGRTFVTVGQTEQTAVLNWETFNIGKQTTLSFDQGKGGANKSQWVAFNKINDPSGAPSQILGAIKAQGQVYVINQNGILFGGSSQINLHGLVASSLPINNNLVSRGLLNNPDQQFLFSSLSLDAGVNGTPAFVPPAPNRIGGREIHGDVVVQPGAQLSAPTSAEGVGGRIALIGPNVKNEGSISTPDGQTILAAGLQVGLAAHASSDPSLRGLDVFIGKVVAPPVGDPPVAQVQYAGTATNAGLIDAPRASVTIAAQTVNQLGAISSTTSVAANGRVDLLASYNATPNPPRTPEEAALNRPAFLSNATGTVTLGDGSVTEVLPELDSTDTVPGTELALRSQVNLEGRVLHLNGGSTILAPGAAVALRAGIWLPLSSNENRFVFANDADPKRRSQIFLETGATINVAGSIDIAAPLEQNILSVELRGAELADSPLQRMGLLRAQTLLIDVRRTGVYNGRTWVGTPLGDAAGFVGLIQRTVGELTTAGGTVTMSAGNSVLMQAGSTVDVSGGWVNYAGGMVQTTRVLSGGQILDISQATPDRIYDGIYTGKFTTASAKWGVSETFNNPLALTGARFEPGYLQGARGGTIAITAPSMALDGSLFGQTAAGPRQQQAAVPTPSTLALSFQGQDTSNTNFLTNPPVIPPRIVFASGRGATAVSFAVDAAGTPAELAAGRQAEVLLSPDLFDERGFGFLTVNNTDGDIAVPSGVKLQTPAGGSITLAAANVDIQGELIAPGGALNFTTYDISPFRIEQLAATPNSLTPAVDPTRGSFRLGSGAVLSTAGLIVDDRPGVLGAGTRPFATAGGTVTIRALNTDLAIGSTIDVSGGIVVRPNGARTFGNGGAIDIQAGREPNQSLPGLIGGSLTLDSTLKGYSGARGGSLSIVAPSVQVGGTSASPNTLLLAPEFFSTGGFTSFTLRGNGAPTANDFEFIPGVAIAPDTLLAPVAQSWRATLNAPGAEGVTLAPTTLPIGLRTPVSLAFSAEGVIDTLGGVSKLLTRGDFVMGAGAVIRTDPGASVTIKGDTADVLGTIVAPGGSISVSGGRGVRDGVPLFENVTAQAVATVHLGPHSQLSTAGSVVLTPDRYGHRTGMVLAGGTITISGNIVAESGALLDVSGTSGVLDLSPEIATFFGSTKGAPVAAFTPGAGSGLNAPLYDSLVVPTRIDSDGGSITLSGSEMLFTDATLRGAAGGPAALGGSLTISSGRFNTGTPLTPLDYTLVVTQDGRTLPDGFAKSGQPIIGNPVALADFDPAGADGKLVAVFGRGHFAVSDFAKGGFDTLTLGGSVKFSGPVSIDARRELTVASAGVIYGDAPIQLRAPHVTLGTPFLPPFSPLDPKVPFTSGGAAFPIEPVFGPGSLTVTAQLIEIGNLSLQNIRRASLLANSGEIRGDGTFDLAGDLLLRAAQIYPPTGVLFTIAAYDKNIAVLSSAVGSPTVTLVSAALPPGFRVGSPLLGSTVTKIEGAVVTLAAGADRAIGSKTPVVFAPGSGSVTIEGSGFAQTPLSADGTLSIYGSNIAQRGVLRAPNGTINLGWDGTGTAPKDLVTGKNVPVTQLLTLAPGSLTSVGALNAVTGEGMLIPYGLNLNGTSWIDPTGTDITLTGAAGKSISLAGVKLNDQGGSLIDIRGGGELYSYRFVQGIGGTQDILASTASFAVIPDYGADFAPFARNNTGANAGSLGGDPGYVNSTLRVGDRVFLGASDGLAAGAYTLLPARYALLPGAFLVTPKAGAPIGTLEMPDGSTFVPGYRFNSLNTSRTLDPQTAWFEVGSAEVVRSRAQYDDFFANDFFRFAAATSDTAAPNLPLDAGHLVLQATQAMKLLGRVAATAPLGGRGGLVDIASSTDIVVTGGSLTGQAGKLVLNAGQLNSFGAESLLIGGVRQFGPNGTTVTVRTGNLTVDNAGTPLTGPEIILVAKQSLALAPGAAIEQTGHLTRPGETLLLGDAAIAGSGDGVLLRVSSDPAAKTVRRGLSAIQPAGITLDVQAGARVSALGLTLDSTSAMSLDPTANFDIEYIRLNSGRISLQLDNPGKLEADPGLVLGGSLLHDLEGARYTSLLSYSSIDLYGTGDLHFGSLALHTGAIRGFNTAGGPARITAGSLALDNSAGSAVLMPAGGLAGTLEFASSKIHLGSGELRIDNFAQTRLDASSGIVVGGTGKLTTQGSLTANTPAISGKKGAQHGLVAVGDLLIQAPNGPGGAEGGLGASLQLQGANVAIGSAIVLPSGSLKVTATGGDISISGRLAVGGTAQTFYDLTKYTDGGQITLSAAGGSVGVTADALLDASANAGGGNAGSISISVPDGDFTIAPETLRARGGAGGTAGTFSLDVGSLASMAALDGALNDGGFTGARSFRVRLGDVSVDGLATARSYALSADQGSITVTGAGQIDAPGATGGTIRLAAHGSVTLQNRALLTVAAEDFNNAGKGGAVTIEAGVFTGGSSNPTAVVDLQSGSTIDLTVASNTPASAALGQFTGTLHLRAPQTAGGADVQMNAIDATVLGASRIVVEGYQVFTPADGDPGSVMPAVQASGTAFGASSPAISTRLLANNAGLASALHVRPGAEIVNPTGDLTLNSDLDLAPFRFGPNNDEPGILTLRAKGSLVFLGALSDGFDITQSLDGTLWLAPLLVPGAQSWSYRLAAGADFAAADFRRVLPLATDPAGNGSLKLGVDGGTNIASNPGQNGTTSSAISGRFQVIRTGTGDIDIATQGSVQLLNQFATIYTAGTQVADPTLGGTFEIPQINYQGQNPTTALGAIQQRYPAQYSVAGGNVTIAAQGNIERLTLDGSGTLVADSSKELPINWLYRRGYVDPVTGLFGRTQRGAGIGETASTTWWVDFSNFFEGVGALGGGNVTMIAGQNISNVDGLVPTQGRMPGLDAGGNAVAPDAGKLIELGGGDLIVRAGQDIDGGAYYVERGRGTLSAGNSIHTNGTRSPSVTLITGAAPLAPETWLPTSLFAGKASFDVTARGDLLLGPVANPFLLPTGVGDPFWERTYFSTYSTENAVNVSSLGGSITLRTAANFTETGSTPMLAAWLQRVLLFQKPPSTTQSFYQPWLRLNVTSVESFKTVAGVLPASLRATAFSGDINLAGSLTLSPSPTGTIDLAASGAINGLQPIGPGISNDGLVVKVWSASTINLSDANPANVPGIASPFAYLAVLKSGGNAAPTAPEFIPTQENLLASVGQLFTESGATSGANVALQTQQALHAPGPLHADDPNPVHLYALGGDISGLTLFSGKSARVVAQRDLSDIALYLQNVDGGDISLAASGRDLIAYNPNSALRLAAQTTGNALLTEAGGTSRAGDIQIGGPGTLEVLVGRNLDLGVGPSNGDGTALGILSIGNARNPFLPFGGASIVAGAGIGLSSGLSASDLDFGGFIDSYLAMGGTVAEEFVQGLVTSVSGKADLKFDALSAEQQSLVALQVFYRSLRDAGRGYSDPASSGFGNYDSGFAAINTLFPGSAWQGKISLTSRAIKTSAGGDISIFAPGGVLTVGFDIAGNQSVDQGILTEKGGNISIFTDESVIVGTSRIFTLKGGSQVIWSSNGDIAAGAASKTVQSAPPTRVLIDPQSADVKTDLAGLATGGGIGVLATVKGVTPGDVDLIAPTGAVDAGDAGIRVSGNLNIAATQVLNAGNIAVSGSSAGVPAAPVVAAPNLGGIAAASNTAGAASAAATQQAASQRENATPTEEAPSIITVEVVGYGGGEG